MTAAGTQPWDSEGTNTSTVSAEKRFERPIFETDVMFSARDETPCQKATLHKVTRSRLSWYFSVLYSKCRLRIQVPHWVAAISLVLTQVNAKNATNCTHCSAPSFFWITTELFTAHRFTLFTSKSFTSPVIFFHLLSDEIKLLSLFTAENFLSISSDLSLVHSVGFL